MRRYRAAAVAAALMAGLTVLPSPATAAPEVIATGAHPSLVSSTVAVAPDGTTVVVWAVNPHPDLSTVVLRARFVSPDGAKGAVLHIADALPAVAQLSVSVNDRGQAVAAWAMHDDVNWGVYGTRFSSGGAVLPTTRLSAAGQVAWRPQAVVTNRGRAFVSFHQGPRSPSHGYGRVLGPRGRSGPIVWLGDEPDLATCPDGSVVVTATRQHAAVRAARLTAAGSWTHRLVSADEPLNAKEAQVGCDGSSRARIVYVLVRKDVAPMQFVARGRVWHASGRLDDSVRITPSDLDPLSLAIATDRTGRTLVVWAVGGESGDYRLRARVWSDAGMSPIGSVGTAAATGAPPTALPPVAEVTITGTGRGLITWYAEQSSRIRPWVRPVSALGRLGTARSLCVACAASADSPVTGRTRLTWVEPGNPDRVLLALVP